MKLALWRTQSRPDCTKGVLYVDGSYACFTLELPRVVDHKINLPNVTCVLAGEYPVTPFMSEHMHCRVPLLGGVANRESIEIHVLNKPCQTNGCIGVGDTWTPEAEIDNSQAAFDRLMACLNAAWARSEAVTLTITGLDGAADAE